MVNFNPLTAEISPVVCGTPANFNGFHILALLHGIGRQPNFAALNRGRHLYSAGLRAAITLGIGPHSSFVLLSKSMLMLKKPNV